MTVTLPKTWSNPQGIVDYARAAGENFLNVIPPSCFEAETTTFPSKIGDTHYVMSARLIRQILRDDVDNFPKSRSISVVLAPLIPRSIFVTHGKQWRDQHTVAIQAFNFRNIQKFEGNIQKTAENFVKDKPFVEGEDIVPRLQELTLQVISQVLTGRAQSPEFDNLRNIFDQALPQILGVNVLDILAVRFPWFPNIRHLTKRKINKNFRSACAVFLDQRVKSPPQNEDFLDFFLELFLNTLY